MQQQSMMEGSIKILASGQKTLFELRGERERCGEDHEHFGAAGSFCGGCVSVVVAATGWKSSCNSSAAATMLIRRKCILC